MITTDVNELPPIGIGAAIQLYGLTPRAIRFYEEKRLIAARRDHLNRRYYDHVARRRLEWISRLRRAGIGLDEIRQVLNGGPEELAPARAAEAGTARCPPAAGAGHCGRRSRRAELRIRRRLIEKRMLISGQAIESSPGL